MNKPQRLFLGTFLALGASLNLATAQVTAFNYTGFLLEGNAPASGSNDLQFTLYAAPTGGSPLGSTNTLLNQPVNNGIFVVLLDFGGGVFDGSARWLELSARASGSGNPFTNTFPRQAITAAPYAVYANNGVPVGSVMAYMGTNPPAGWLLCDGSAVSRTTYATLYAVILNSSGSGNGSTTFNLPDLRGMFLRGVNGSRTGTYADPGDNRVAAATGGNPGNTVGSIQTDAFANHDHQVGSKASDTTAMITAARRLPDYANDIWGSSPALRTSFTGGNETRPKNAYVNYIIKY